MRNRLGWVVDGRPPAPSAEEQAQARAGHIDVDIQDIKRRAGIVTEEVTPSEAAIGDAIAELMALFEEVPAQDYKQTQARLGDVIQILRRGIGGGRVDAGY